jgi:hypothetical protein
MQRLFEIVKTTVRRPFASWREFVEYLIFLGVGIAGMVHASWLWIGIGAMLLLLLSWERYAELFVKAGRIDREYRELAALSLRHDQVALSLGLFARARALPFVLMAKLGLDAAFLAGAYVFGVAAGWFWDVP